MLHVLTACTRPENLPKMAESLQAWGKQADFIWHIRFDIGKQHVGGQAIKNQILEEISDGYVMFLDDDTVVHPMLWKRLRQYDGKDAIVFSQNHEILGILHAAPENAMIGTIDIGQAIIKRDVIGLHRIPESYAGDGEFMHAILPHCDAVYVDEVLSIHNALQ